MSRIALSLRRSSKLWPGDLKPLALKALNAALAELSEKPAGTPVGAPAGTPAEISVLLASDAEQAALNRQWRGKAGPTNVLSFPAKAPGGRISGVLGDISMGYQTVSREARELGIPFRHHFAHLLVHGFLHILGYDHERDGDAARMEALETAILARLSIPDPYGPARADRARRRAGGEALGERRPTRG